MSVVNRAMAGRARASSRSAGSATTAARATGSFVGPATRGLLLVGFAVAALAGLIPLVQDSGATIKGYQLRDLERARDDRRARTQALENEVAALSSIERVRREATERLGMVAPKQTVFVEVGEPGPSGTLVPERYLPAGDKTGGRGAASWWSRIVGSLLP